MQIEGVISSVLFQNPDTEYCVMRLNNDIVVVGYAPFVSVGVEYKFIGEFRNNAKHGKQFAFTEMVLLPPNTESKIIHFLGGGLIPGIGPATAKKIVKEFGIQSMEIIQSNPEELSRVRGISLDKARKISSGYAEVREMQAVIMWLYKFNLGLNTAIKIYKEYGSESIQKISKNPYNMIERVDGIGFITADKMAKDLGVSYNGTFRVRAGVVHILKESAEMDGDTFVTLSELIKKVCRLLRINMVDLTPTFNSIINELCMDRIVVPVEIDGQQGIQLMKFFVAEKSIAQKLLLLANEKKEVKNLDNLITHYEQLKGITFHENQKLAIKSAVNNGVTIITGGPGTGKTTIINAIFYINQASDLSTQMLAPTGRAAKRIEETTGQEAMTIHRCLDIDYKNTGGKAFIYEDPNNFIKKDIVILDEVSMCDCMLMASLLRKIMHGTKVIFIGDIDQLASVGAGNVLSDMITSGVLPVIQLTQIYRTGEDSTIAVNAYKINKGEMPLLNNKSIDFFYDRAETPLEIKNKVVDLLSVRLPEYLKTDSSKIQVLAPMKLGEAGVNNLNTVLQDVLNPQRGQSQYTYGETIFRLGDRVMHTVNNYKQEWKKGGEEGKGIFNGDIGKIIDINPESGETTVELEDGRVSIYSRSDLVALTLSYAITVHKSQGCEFDAVVIPVVSGAYMILTRNLLYTAVTRAKKLVVLVGKEENIKKMVENTYTKKRNSCLSKYLQHFNTMS